jgi:hypothetical protein
MTKTLNNDLKENQNSNVGRDTIVMIVGVSAEVMKYLNIEDEN